MVSRTLLSLVVKMVSYWYVEHSYGTKENTRKRETLFLRKTPDIA